MLPRKNDRIEEGRMMLAALTFFTALIILCIPILIGMVLSDFINGYSELSGSRLYPFPFHHKKIKYDELLSLINTKQWEKRTDEFYIDRDYYFVSIDNVLNRVSILNINSIIINNTYYSLNMRDYYKYRKAFFKRGIR